MSSDLQRAKGQSLEDIVLDDATVERLQDLGISRRRFLGYCAGLASLMALPPSFIPKLAKAATSPSKPSVVYMSFQECTGCLESMVNSFAFGGGQTIDNLILNLISLDYQETLMAAAGAQAEGQLHSMTVEAPASSYILVVDGSIPADPESGYFVSGGRSGVARFYEAARNARAIVAVGTCASFGGLPKADPNPTGAVSISDLMLQLGIKKPLINVSGCPPIPEVITGTILLYVTSNFTVPSLDNYYRPTKFYGKTIHRGCYRRETFEEGPYARSFDDTNARRGRCLYYLGCKGPLTHNACATIKWNQGVSFPMMSGHGCIGCSEPNFWDRLNTKGQKGFYYAIADEPYDGHGGDANCNACHDGDGDFEDDD